ncbi:TadE/TadG family type IV pilus assembly protein [Nocardioides sp. SOB77]|uniref:TadE/TadG family type IV pilus assembly protein n=1 Tax=Nocardioides oceani TaxID=3058369 RepID=A0ABT8FDW4_9ACTN|nr:TadE/TadG family type IV pilus assembly protein [Nocardioides oceani]MDN4172851.1 TadE/TadG family type IV pilus assembly protein [Nocardioides oceani]
MTGSRTHARRAGRGAAAVEGALVLSVFLVPMLMGLIYYGHYFWQAQRVAPIGASVSGAGIYGQMTCGTLTTRVQQLLASAVSNVDAGLGQALDPVEDIVVTVLPLVGGIGADVQVRLRLPIVTTVLPFLPLPDGGDLVEDLLLRLENVRITTGASC